MLQIIILITLLILLYKWSTSTYGTFKERGILHPKPWPLFGNMSIKLILGKESIIAATVLGYNTFKGSKIYGAYNFRQSMIMISDVNIAKKICIKDFDIFTNHNEQFFNIEGHPLGKSLIALKDRQWREMRNTLTPTFTGNKMRLMFHLINECCVEAVNYIETLAPNSEGVEIDMKDYFRKFANDVIATTAFGIKMNSFNEINEKFYEAGKEITKFNLFKSSLYTLFPKIMKQLGVKYVDTDKIDYFKSVVFDAIAYRKKHNIQRPDIIHQLMEAQRNFEATKLTTNDILHATFTDDDLLSQCLIFFFAGFETISACLSYTAHELGLNPDIQQRLYEEILEVEKERNNEPLNYDILMKMKYMDMVLSESLRKWPPAVATDRFCTQDYKLYDEDENFIAVIKKGEMVIIPIVGFHYDEEFYPNPHKFDPERFAEENKDNLNMSSYMPFGIGPRSCIGNRFALMETKSIIYHMLLKFKLTATDKTTKDLFNNLRGVQPQPKDGFWLKIIPRN